MCCCSFSIVQGVAICVHCSHVLFNIMKIYYFFGYDIVIILFCLFIRQHKLYHKKLILLSLPLPRESIFLFTFSQRCNVTFEVYLEDKNEVRIIREFFFNDYLIKYSNRMKIVLIKRFHLDGIQMTRRYSSRFQKNNK